MCFPNAELSLNELMVAAGTASSPQEPANISAREEKRAEMIREANADQNDRAFTRAQRDYVALEHKSTLPARTRASQASGSELVLV